MRSRADRKLGVNIRIANSLFLERFSLIRVRKFPVPLYREFDRKPLNWLETDAEVAGGEPDSSKIPVNFPVSREFRAETGSQLTASSASQSGLCGLCPGCKNTCDIPES